MTKFTFADRYADAGISPSAEIIKARQVPAHRIIAKISDKQILDLAGVYYGSQELDLSWFRDEFAKEDEGFTLVSNERETRVLAAIILGDLVEQEIHEAILAVIVGGVAGCRTPSEAEWLLHDAKEALGKLSVAERRPAKIAHEVTPTISINPAEEVAAISQNDWVALKVFLEKITTESQISAKTNASQSTNALSALNLQVRLLREESQMLWWLFGGHSKLLERSFATLAPQQAALVCAIDLGTLTTVSHLGPVAAPAMLERILALAKRPKGQQPNSLSSAIDGLAAEDLEQLKVFSTNLPARLAPVTAAIGFAQTMGISVWHKKFRDKTGLEASMSLDPVALAEQLYREHLLGQML
jgi:hypothetical protein